VATARTRKFSTRLSRKWQYGADSRTKTDSSIRKAAKRYRDGKRHIKKSHGHFQQDIEMRYPFIQKHRASFPVKKMCRSFSIFPSGFYRWQKRPYSRRRKENDRIRERILSLYNEHNGMAGSPMITADLRSEPGFENVGKNTVARHMKAMGLRCRTVKKFVATSDSKQK